MLGITYLAVLVTAPLLWITPGGREIQWGYGWLAILTLFVSFVHLVVLLWARDRIGTRLTLALYAIGMICQVILTLDHTNDNAWKFGLAVPITLLGLVIASRGRPFWSVLVLLAVAYVSILCGFRSFVAFAIVAVIGWVWNARSNLRSGWKLVGFAAVGVLAYWAGTQAALAGWLGERNRIVTEQQIEAAGSVIAGGRVESTASFALFAARPIGIGPGVLPLPSDIAVGETALVGRGVNIDGQYVNDYLFGAGVKLHSIVADLWVNYGLIGLALALLLAWITIRALVRALSDRATPIITFFLIVVVLWDLAFSPIGTNLWETILALAMLLPMSLTRNGIDESVPAPNHMSASFDESAINQHATATKVQFSVNSQPRVKLNADY